MMPWPYTCGDLWPDSEKQCEEGEEDEALCARGGARLSARGGRWSWPLGTGSWQAHVA